MSTIFREGDRRQTNNYQPISLTSAICKTMASIIHDMTMHHLVHNRLLTKHQHGFVKAISCVTQILTVLDNGSNTDSLYIDFAKAFDVCRTNASSRRWRASTLWGNYRPGSRNSPGNNPAGSYQWRKVPGNVIINWCSTMKCYRAPTI